MPTLYPPAYPERPDAPLAAFGVAFAQEIARSAIAVVCYRDDDQPDDQAIRVAAALTMLEAFYPRDQLECMMAAQGAAAHATVMECLAQSFAPGVEPALAIKLRANAVQVHRMFSATVHDLEKRQAKPLPARPVPPPSGGEAVPSPVADGPIPAAKAANVPTAAKAANAPASAEIADDLDAALEADLRTRPDGTPGSLEAYAFKAPEGEVYIPREPAIMLALANRPKPWRQVNAPNEPPGPARPAAESVEPPGPGGVIGPDGLARPEPGREVAAEAAIESPPPRDNVVSFREKYHEGDALARFASTRFDPDAPRPPADFPDDEVVVELEVISTGGDPETEAHAAALAAAHPEGKPISIRRYGTPKPPADPGRET